MKIKPNATILYDFKKSVYCNTIPCQIRRECMTLSGNTNTMTLETGTYLQLKSFGQCRAKQPSDPECILWWH